MTDRRQILVPLKKDWILEQFGRLSPRYRVTLPELPDDYEITDVHYDYYADCFYLRVWSATFPEVPEGAVYPIGSGAMQTRIEVSA